MRLNKAVASIASDSAEATRLGAILKMSIGTDVDIDALSNAVAKASMDPDMRAEMNKTDLGEEFRKAGNSLAKYLDGQKEMPSGPGERTYIRSVFSQILSELQQKPEYADLTMADLQAVLWYAEKRLYETAKEDIAADEDTEGYADDEAPDYANAAAAVARTNGVSDRKIQNAMKKEEANGRAGDARPADGGTGGQGPEGGSTESRGFTPQEKRTFVGAVAVRRARYNRNSDAGQSWSYSGRRYEGNRGFGSLKKLGVTWSSEWKPGKALGNVLRNNGFSTPTFHELAQGNEKNAQRFAELVTDSKNQSGAYGAAVNVYAAEEYKSMRLFLAKDGSAGVAIKPDGDIVSVFSNKGANAGRAVMELAVRAGGTKLDAFATILPGYYAAHGAVLIRGHMS